MNGLGAILFLKRNCNPVEVESSLFDNDFPMTITGETLVISKLGILIKEELIIWNQIRKYEIIEQNYRRKTYSLNIETSQKSIIIDVDDLTFIPEDIRSLIILYKGMNSN